MNKTLLLTFLILTTLCCAQNSPSQRATVDFKQAKASIVLDTLSIMVVGNVEFKLDILKDTDSIFLDAKNLDMYSVQLDGVKQDSTNYNQNRLAVYHKFESGKNYNLKLEFHSTPDKALYFIDADQNYSWEQAWTQGQGKYTSNWMPSIDDTNDKMVWQLDIAVPKGLKPVANGDLKKMVAGKNLDTYSYGMLQPMSSYLLAFAVGDYESFKEVSDSGVNLQFYYYPGQKSEAYTTYHDSKKIFDYLEREIGIAYPWQNYKQVPVKDFLYSGMENTGTTIFNDQFMVDEIGVNDRDYLSVNAHELAHQWFGNLVTAKSGKDHWLQEGFATYYSMLAEREVYGDAYFSMQLYQQAEALIEASKRSSKKAVTDENASSLTFYQHGAWALHALKNKIGYSRFRESVQRYLETYSYKNASTADFIAVVEEVTGEDLSQFESTWLQQPKFPTEESLRILRQDLFMEAYFQLAARRVNNFDEAYQSYKETLKKPVEKELVKEMIAQLALRDDVRKFDLQKKAAALNIPEVNQLISLSSNSLNEYNKEMIAGLIDDPSYITRENALYLLWQYSDNRKETLNVSKKSWKSTSPSLEMAWNALALNTDGFTKKQALKFLGELRKYTLPKYDTQTRTAAFDYLVNINAMSEQNYLDLMEASTHHVWRFYKNARELLQALYKKPQGKSQINQILLTMDQENAAVFEDILKRA